MSQIDQISQEYVEYFKDSRNFRGACGESNEDELSGDEQNEDSVELFEKLSSFFRYQKLSKCSLVSLSKMLEVNLNSFFVRRFKSLTSRLNQDEDDQAEEQINQLIAAIEAIYDHLKSLAESGSVINYQDFSGFFLSTLKSSCILFEYLKAFIPSSSDSQQQQTLTASQFAVSHLNPFQADLSKKLNTLILKFSGLFENKVNNLHDQNSLMQLTFYQVKLLSEYITEYKSAVYLWKVLTKLICKQQIFLDIKSPDMISFGNVSYRTVISNFFLTLYENLYLNLKTIRASIDSIVSGSNDLSIITVSFMNSQSTSGKSASLLQDTLKRLKFTGFLIKIYNKFVSLYQQSWLTSRDSYFRLTCIFSALASILFTVPEIDPNELASGHEASGVAKDYQTILQESVKELAAFFEQLIGLLGQNYKYHLFLSDGSLLDVAIANDSDKTGESMQKPRQDVLSHYEQIEYFEDSLVFVSYFIGRFYAGADLDKTLSFLNLARKMSDDGERLERKDQVDSLPFLDVIFRISEICIKAFNLPTHVVFFEPSQKDLPSKLIEIANSNPSHHCIELYEFVLHALEAYAVNLLSLPDCNETLSYYLLNNLITEGSSLTKKQEIRFSMRVSFSYDLILFCSKLDASNSRNPFKYIHSLLEVYEFFSGLETRSSYSFVHIEMLLVELVEFHCSQVAQLKAFEDYLRDKKLYDSYALIASQIGSKQFEAVFTSAFNKLTDFYNEFTVFTESLFKSNQKDQVLLKKLSAFIQTKYGLKFSNLVENLLTGQTTESTVPTIKKQAFPQIDNKLASSLFNIEILERFLNLLENSKMNDNFHISCELYFKSINIWATLKANKRDLDTSDPADAFAVLSFLGKLIQSDFGPCQFKLNFKLLTGYVLRTLSSVEITNPALKKQMVESFCLLLADTNLIVVNNTLECLNDFLQSNCMISEIARSTSITQNVKEDIAHYVNQEAFNCGKSAKEILHERSKIIIERVVLHRNKDDDFLPDDTEEQNLDSESEDEHDAMMDETMNLLCSMDTTISNPSQKSIDSQRKKEQTLLEEFDEQLEQLVSKYNEDERSKWFKEQFTDLWKSKLRSINR